MDSPPRLGLVVRFQLLPGAAHLFDALTDNVRRQIRVHEPDTLLYECHHVDGDEDARLFYELYASREAFRHHESSPHVKRFLIERSACLIEDPRVEFLFPR
jgi:quinol monooxygenase YgiN